MGMKSRGEQSYGAPWYAKGVLYQIYPLSFADANGDGYGDIGGILDHLDYLAGSDESLGVAAVWLSPMYVSPMKDYGYDVANFCDIDPVFGDLASFDRLVAALHERGIKILMDFVPNHTSDQHAWFRESKQSKVSPKRDWYIWADGKADGSEPNNWLSAFGGPAWTHDKVTDQYYLHTFLSSQPDLNWRNPEVREAMTDVLRFWLARGVDGFRTDAVYYLIKDEGLRDDPANPHYREGQDDPATRLLPTHSAGQHELFDLLEGFCDAVAAGGGELIVSEAYLGIKQMQKLYKACRNHPIHAPFNFNLMTLPWGAESFGDWIDTYEASLGPADVPNYVLGNHDRSRLASRLGQPRARLIAMLQLSLRGLPVVYYGDELGMENSVVRGASERDPWGLQVPGYGLGRDMARGPMPWSVQKHYGFTEAEPWLPAATNAQSAAVSLQRRDPESMFSLYRQMIHLKATMPALYEGRYERIKTDSTDIYAFERSSNDDRCIIVLNFAANATKVSLHGDPEGILLTSTHVVDGSPDRGKLGRLRLEAYEGRIYHVEHAK